MKKINQYWRKNPRFRITVFIVFIVLLSLTLFGLVAPAYDVLEEVINHTVIKKNTVFGETKLSYDGLKTTIYYLVNIFLIFTLFYDVFKMFRPRDYRRQRSMKSIGTSSMLKLLKKGIFLYFSVGVSILVLIWGFKKGDSGAEAMISGISVASFLLLKFYVKRLWSEFDSHEHHEYVLGRTSSGKLITEKREHHE